MPLLDPWHPDVPASAVGMHPFSTLCRGLNRSLYLCDLSICWFAALGQNGVHSSAVERGYLRRVCGMLGPEIDEGAPPSLHTLWTRADGIISAPTCGALMLVYTSARVSFLNSGIPSHHVRCHGCAHRFLEVFPLFVTETSCHDKPRIQVPSIQNWKCRHYFD
jgi:hypothetical protein